MHLELILHEAVVRPSRLQSPKSSPEIPAQNPGSCSVFTPPPLLEKVFQTLCRGRRLFWADRQGQGQGRMVVANVFAIRCLATACPSLSLYDKN